MRCSCHGAGNVSAQGMGHNTAMPDLTLNGVRIHFEESGAGQPLVMLHGLNSDRPFMQGEIRTLSREFRVIALDSRGHGLS